MGGNGLRLVRLLGLCLALFCLGVAWAGPEEEGLNVLSEQETVEYLVVGKAVFTDALGKPMPGNTKVTTGGKPVELGPDASVNALKLAKMFKGYVEVSHPSYGRVRFYDLPRVLKPYIVLPLVKDGTPEAMRAPAGRVLDDVTRSVADAELVVQMTGDEYLPNSLMRVMSDEKGRYRLHPAMLQENVGRGPGPMLAEREGVWVQVDKSAPGWVGRRAYANGGNCMIMLKRGPRDYVIKINGIKDAGHPPRIRTYIRSSGKENYYYEWNGVIKPGERMVLADGTYVLEVNGVSYQPVTVNDQSPLELVFEPRPLPRCVARVVDGETGKPMEGALVVVMGERLEGTNIAGIDQEDWDKLAGLKPPVDFYRDMPAGFKEKLGYRSQYHGTKTNEKGEFEFRFKNHDTERIVVLAKGMMPLTRSISPFRVNADGVVRTRDIEMVPSATLVLDPGITPEQQAKMQADGVHLACDVHAPTKFSARFEMSAVENKLFLGPLHFSGAKQEVLVPANVPVDVILTRFQASDRRGLVPNGPVMWTMDPVTLKPGERVEAALRREELTKVKLKLELSDGGPIDMVHVGLRVAEEADVWARSPATDADGMTTLYCPAGRRVRLGLSNPLPVEYTAWVDVEMPKEPGETPITVKVPNRVLTQFLWASRVEDLKNGPRGKALKLQN